MYDKRKTRNHRNRYTEKRFWSIARPARGDAGGREAVTHGVCRGLYFFDTARAYSDSEEKIGEALADVREHIFISTKTMATTVEKFWKDLETSFANLKTDYVDIYQFHNPSFCPQSGDGDIAAGAAAAISAKKRHFAEKYLC